MPKLLHRKMDNLPAEWITVHITDKNPWTGKVFRDMREIRAFHTKPEAPDALPAGWVWINKPWVALSDAGLRVTYGRGWSDAGYHWGIALDGAIEAGRPEAIKGAHVRGHNWKNIGVVVCSVDGSMWPNQTASLVYLLKDLVNKHRLSYERIRGHKDWPDVAKECPGFESQDLRRLLRVTA